MKQIQIFALMATLLTTACVGKVEPSDSYNITLEANTPQVSLAAGERVELKVKDWSVDVTDQAELYYTHAGKEVAIESGVFTPTEAGDYTFAARYQNQACPNSITIRAYNDDELSDDFLRRHLVMKFTAYNCVNCPVMGEVITHLEHERPFEIVEIAIHANDKHLGVVEGEEIFKELGYSVLPTVVVDMYNKNEVTQSAKSKIEEVMELSATSNPTVAGVRINSTLDGNKLDIEVGVKASIAGDYKVAVAVVADNFHYKQTGAPSANYKQNKVLQLYASDKYGDAISGFEASKDNTLSYQVTLPANLPGDCRVVAYVLSKQSDGEYRINNSTECEAGKKIDYIYKLK